MKITGNELVTLLHLEMSSDKIVDIIDRLGFEQPTLDEEYELNRCIDLIDNENNKIALVFSELDSYSKNGDLQLSQIDFYSDDKIEAPFNLDFNNSYDDCCQIFSKKATFKNKYSQQLKIWLIDKDDKEKYYVAINFKDKELSKIKSIIVSIFDEKNKKKFLLPN